MDHKSDRLRRVFCVLTYINGRSRRQICMIFHFEELDRTWDALLAGGGRAQACGWLIDGLGPRWQIVPAALDGMR